MINSRLFDWYNIDTNKYLNIKNKCPKPFDTILINQTGSCFICECTAWLPQSVGNLYNSTLKEIFSSTVAQELRSSIEDGSYRYCNNQQCTWILKNDVRHYHGIEPKISQIRLAIDDSCNLSCPSCRNSLIFHKKGNILKMRFLLSDRINEYLKEHNDINIHIGSDGDPFASLVYRHFMRTVPDNKTLTFNIQTNGLLVKKMFGRLENIFDRLKVLNISIDGATKNTYESLRRGGQFEKLLENLEFIKDYHKHFEIKIHMVVQKQNWKEMNMMLELADRYNAKQVIFNKITNWNTYKNFNEQIVPEDSEEFQKELEIVKKNNKTILWQYLGNKNN